MAIATFHSLRGEKSALLMVKVNALVYSATPVYVPQTGVTEFANRELTDDDKGETFEIPDGFKLIDIIDIETGEVRTAKNGEPLKTLSY